LLGINVGIESRFHNNSVTLIVEAVTPESLITAILSPEATGKISDVLFANIGLVVMLAVGADPNWIWQWPNEQATRT